ncbi:MAG: hypothetical protein HXY37_16670 [Chloroflexi bacterium]|nr:hypothetical protein [Chloroflexota bacterium]
MTIILHGTWLPQAQRLFVWGEDGQAFGRAARKAKIPAHPFQATVADLQRLTAHCTPRAEPAEQEQVVWLPAVAGRPAPLRELRAGPASALADLLARYDEPDPALAQISAQIAAPLVEAAILKRYGAAPANTQAPLSTL